MAKKRILLVEDEKDMVYAVTMQLESSGFEVIPAYDGQQALEEVKKSNPDLIILDIMLPKIDGYKVCRMLKFDKKYNQIPIILFTARAQESDKKLGDEVGADAYITKPFEPQVLLDKIKKLLYKKSS